jgi:hypothetical protein
MTSVEADRGSVIFNKTRFYAILLYYRRHSDQQGLSRPNNCSSCMQKNLQSCRKI